MESLLKFNQRRDSRHCRRDRGDGGDENQGNDEEKTNDAPEVGYLWVSNHGSIGFTVEFDVTAPSDSGLFRFDLKQDGSFVDDGYAPSDTIESDYCGWLDIPGYGGGPPLPHPSYLYSFDFTIKGVRFFYAILLGGIGGVDNVLISDLRVDISLYVIA